MPPERVAFCVQGPAQVLGIFRPRLRQEARAAPSRPPARPKRLLKRLFRCLPWEIRLAILAPIYLGIPALIGIACAFVYYTATIPNPKTLRQKDRPPVVRILDRDGAAADRARRRRGLRADRYVAAASPGRGGRHRGSPLLRALGRGPGRAGAGLIGQPEGRPVRPGRVDIDPAARQEPVPDAGAHARPQAGRAGPRPVAGGAPEQARHPRDLSQPRVSRQRRLRRRDGVAALLRQAGQPADAAGIRHARRPAEGAIEVLAGSQSGRGTRACARRAGQDGRSGHAHGRGGGAGRQRSDRASPTRCTSARIRVSSMRSMPCSSACRGWLAPRLAS